MSKIEWLQIPGYRAETWNPVTGCSPISAGCRNCWAKRQIVRHKHLHGYNQQNPFEPTYHPIRHVLPLRWRKPRAAFVCSMGDLFHPGITNTLIYQIFWVMSQVRKHLFFVLTKRSRRMARIMPVILAKLAARGKQYNLDHVRFGVSVENQKTFDKRVPHLLDLPTKKFISIEPMIDEIDPGDAINQLEWVIVGCESLPGGYAGRWRSKILSDADDDQLAGWNECAVQIIEQCKTQKTPVFIKQVPDVDGTVSHDPAEWPEELRVREWPV